MRFVSVRDLNTRPKEIWRKIKEGEVVITSNGKPIALLTAVTEENLEKNIRAILRSRAVVALEEMQKQSLADGLDRISDAQIESEIKAVRKKRNR